MPPISLQSLDFLRAKTGRRQAAYTLYAQFLYERLRKLIIGAEGKAVMNCLYCGKSFRLASRDFHDPDFCRPDHRWKFNKRLDVAIRLIHRADEMHPTEPAGFS